MEERISKPVRVGEPEDAGKNKYSAQDRNRNMPGDDFSVEQLD
jgi:hypothetical protein